jgi:AAA domain
MNSVFVSAREVPYAPVSWLWENRIPRSALTLFEGNPGGGKSTVLYDIAARVSTGRGMPDGRECRGPAGVVWVSDEDTASTSRRILETHGADLSRVSIYDKRLAAGNRLKLPADIDSLEREIQKYQAELVVLDPISAFIEGSINSEMHVRRALGPLTAIAEQSGAAIVLNRHLRKSGTGSALHQGVGSVGIIAAARAGILIGTEPGNAKCRVMAPFKSNLAPIAASLSFELIQEAGSVRLNWLGPSEYTAEQVLAASTDKEVSALEEAAFVLYSVLGNGPLWAQEAKRLVMQAGVTDRTLRRAKDLLLVRSKRIGFGKSSQFYWTLPQRSVILTRLREKDLDDLADELFGGGPQLFPETAPPWKADASPRFFYRPEDDEDDDDPADWWKRR